MKHKFSNSRLGQASKAFVLAAFLLMAFVVPSYATEPFKVGVVSIETLMREAKAAQSIRKQVEKERSSYQKKIKDVEGKLKSSEQELVKQKSILSEEAFVEKRKSFEKDIFSAQKDIRDKGQSLERAYGEAMVKLRKEILEIVAKLAEEKKIDLVLPQNQVVIAASGMDLTQEVLKRLDKKVQKISVKLK